jgi:hypothetical protein
MVAEWLNSLVLNVLQNIIAAEKKASYNTNHPCVVLNYYLLFLLSANIILMSENQLFLMKKTK